MRKRGSTGNTRDDRSHGLGEGKRSRLVGIGRRLRSTAHGLVGRVRLLLACVLVSLVVFGVSGVVAVACEGTGGPPSSPPGSSQTGAGPNPSAPKVAKCSCGDPVDSATGNESEEQTDISIGGRGPGLRVVRSYNSFVAVEAKEAGPWGFGWTGPYDARLEVNSKENTAAVFQENGSTAIFYKSGETYTQGGWMEARLVKEISGSYVYTLPTQSKLEFNSEGKLVKETERDGNSNTLTYKEGKLEKVEDGDKRTLTFKYNGEGLVESVTDPMKHVVSYTYHEKQLASVTIEGKVRWEFEYGSVHLLTKVIDGRKHATTIKYESGVPRRVEEEEYGGHKRKWKYGANETTLTEPNGSETVEKFNTAGEPTKITRAKGKGEETTTEYEYNAETYNRVKMINGDKHEWKYGYDSEGNLTSETDPNGDERKWTYDKKHDVETETTPEGEKTTYKLNGKGNPEAVEREIGGETQKTEYKYDEQGDLTEIIDPLKHATKYTYDGAGNKETETDAEGDERKWKYNEDSQETEETSPRGFKTKTERNEYGLPTKIEDPLKHTTEYKYDGNQNIESETDGNKHTTEYKYNEENLRTNVIAANKDEVETEYDSEGQMIARKDGNGHTWHYKRNALEQIVEEEDPLKQVTKKKYDKAGNLESFEDAEKDTTEYKYDESNRLKSIKYSTGSPSEVTYEYNKDSKVTKIKDETGTTENTYDKLDRLTEYKNGAEKVIKYKYNLVNLPTIITYPDGKEVKREYDQDNRLEKVTDWKSNSTSFKYTKDSELEKTIFPGSENEDVYGYNEADQMTEIHYKHGAESLGSLVYERDGDGQVKKTTTTVLPGPATSESVLDEDSRLIEANAKKYEYDKANNPTKIEGESGYKYNEADELTEGPSAKYTFTEDDQRHEAKPTSGPATTYTYNQAGNLTAVKREQSGETSEINDSYTYDGTGLRQTQTINGTKTKLTWDTAEELPLILEDETNSYIYGPSGLPIEQIPTSGEPLFLHHDQQGSTRLLTNTTGTTETAYTYTPYGRVEATAGTATTPLRYDAQYTNTDTGLIYLRARYYDPLTAQFLSVDPALEITGEPYTYTTDNPENNTDPSGEYVYGYRYPGGGRAGFGWAFGGSAGGCGAVWSRGGFNASCGASTLGSSIGWGTVRGPFGGTWWWGGVTPVSAFGCGLAWGRGGSNGYCGLSTVTSSFGSGFSHGPLGTTWHSQGGWGTGGYVCGGSIGRGYAYAHCSGSNAFWPVNGGGGGGGGGDEIEEIVGAIGAGAAQDDEPGGGDDGIC
jgi:RHS repeat-associated protein